MTRSAVSILSVCITFFFTHAASQTAWFKYEGNPVLVGTSGTWDSFQARIDQVIPGDTMKMWYTGASSGSFPFYIGYGTSVNGGITWTKYPNPVVSPTPGTWDASASLKPSVILIQSEYKMWYTGNNGSYRIGYATSPDGITWVKRTDAVLGAGGSGWWSNGVQHPSVVPNDTGGYTMWVQGSPQFVFGRSTGANDTSWTQPVQVFADVDNVYYQRVTFNGQFYEMWYSITFHPNSSIKYATSSDGINWTIASANPVLTRGPGSWDLQGILPGYIHFDGSTYHMWYSGSSGTGAGPWRTGYAVSPKGTNYWLSTRDSIINSVADTVQITIRVDNPAELQFSAKIKIKSSGVAIDTVQLFDDGAHDDSLAADGIFSNSWVFPDSNSYSISLTLTMHDTLRFEMTGVKELVTSVRDISESRPLTFGLLQNYPNPFNPTTRIQFSVVSRQFTVLKIFDILGREVATLVNEELNSGSYNITLDASEFASGVYFYRLQAGEFIETKKLVLMR